MNVLLPRILSGFRFRFARARAQSSGRVAKAICFLLCSAIMCVRMRLMHARALVLCLCSPERGCLLSHQFHILVQSFEFFDDKAVLKLGQ